MKQLIDEYVNFFYTGSGQKGRFRDCFLLQVQADAALHDSGYTRHGMSLNTIIITTITNSKAAQEVHFVMR